MSPERAFLSSRDHTGAVDSPPLRWLNPRQAATYVHLSLHTLERMRRRGGGPPFHVSGQKKIVYDLADLDAWIRTGGAAR
ncbi:MAG: helix-turn-helix domain-containing protein [Dehalococcoidia bacterium]|nr:helix-turn-helix domain-containing protein [Dehalococcoidia bacterium]